MGEIRGFLRDSHGKFTTFNFPNEPSIFPTAVNQSGEIVGYYDVPFNQQREPVTSGLCSKSQWHLHLDQATGLDKCIPERDQFGRRVIGQYVDIGQITHGISALRTFGRPPSIVLLTVCPKIGDDW
jgi:hypothetical protein